MLTNLARIYLSPPPSSASSEGEFKVGKFIQKTELKWYQKC